RLQEHFMFRGHQCLVFEMLSYNLYDLLRHTTFKGVSLNLIRKFGKQILKALCFLALRDVSVIHCDLKPENILLRHPKRSAIKLIDFGLSDINGKIRQEFGGSAFWMAPEVIREGGKHQISIQSDIWSFGMIILELFCGNPLFSELPYFDQLRTVATLSSPPIPQKLMDDATAIGIWFRSLVTMCLQIDPNSRPTAETLAVFSKTCSISAA
ncbi:MAG: hypothetical protein EBX50_21040, partial [Chitinophagia bacterium]|nr:hypothetical protein [Chitinophagia bacterium]